MKKGMRSNFVGKRIKILFVCPSFSSFIQNDLDILRRHFEVRVAHYQGKKKLLKFLIETLKGVLWADLTFSWFADVHAFAAVLFSKIFKRKSIVVVGGYEVAKVQEINYGAMLKKWKTIVVKFVLKHANKVLAVSEFSKSEILKYINPKNIELVYNGIDCDNFKPVSEKEDLIITVGSVTNAVVKRKGFETFVKSAKYLPNVNFVLIGKHVDNSIKSLKSMAPPNVKFTGFVPDEDLIEYYQRAKVYCQLSRYESFGITLAEAMLCECVPVITNRAALPEVVGDTGFYVPYGNPKATAEALKEAFKSDKGKEARERVKNMFPIGIRVKKIIDLTNKVLKCKE
ncbi:glycosyltransferase family 4 protein [candidate division WOR-3 bacterium]|nr:glycosyltransferase family 4 protein [candidate division WOR-3 bacterium]